MKQKKLMNMLGEKNSVKRTIIIFSLMFILITISSNLIVVFQSHMASRQYEEMLQSVMSVNESKSTVQQIKVSVKNYAETRNTKDYTAFLERRKELEYELEVIEENAGESASILALQSIQPLLKTKATAHK